MSKTGSLVVPEKGKVFDFDYSAYRLEEDSCSACDMETLKCDGGATDGQDCGEDDDCCNLLVRAGAPITPLYPVNFGAAKCKDDQSGEPSTFVVGVSGDPVWVDSKGGIWGIHGLDPDYPDPSSEIYLYENWAADFGCQEWRAVSPSFIST